MAASLIVIRIVPQSPVYAVPGPGVPSPTFQDYLSNNGGLQITAYDVSYNSPTTGLVVGTAIYKAPTAGPSPAVENPPLGYVPSMPTYAAGTGIVQQLDLQPIEVVGLNTFSTYYEYQSVATAVIEFTPASGPPIFENLRLVATWGAGGPTAVPTTQDYYDVPLAAGPAPESGNLRYYNCVRHYKHGRRLGCAAAKRLFVPARARCSGLDDVQHALKRNAACVRLAANRSQNRFRRRSRRNLA